MDQSSTPINRRQFIKTAGAAGAGLVLAGAPLLAQAQGTPALGRKKRFANVGVGSRSQLYQDAINKTYANDNEMVGYCDTNEGRLRYARERAGKDIPLYAAPDFDKMIAETRPDAVIVTTIDGFHHEYIVRTMEAGCDAISEKPMTTNAEKCQAIVDAQKKTGKKLRMLFNYRYSPPRTQVKDLLMQGAIGDVLSVDFHWMLNTQHGADYFRRWHSYKVNSGGLMVHKASHHFDLVNWWLSAVPVSVMGKGKREFYTPKMAKRFGLQSHHERCLTCPEKNECAFMLDLAANPALKALYLDNEQYDGYFRDKCVWRPDITIEDNMNVLATYSNGVNLSYSLNAFNAWEGYHVVFNGTKGRLEHDMIEHIYVNGGADGKTPVIVDGPTTIRVYPLRGAVDEIAPWTGEGSHAGGDAVMLDDLFLATPPADKYRRAADFRAGAYSCLTGIAANKSFETGEGVKIADLVEGLTDPEYPAMPNHEDPVPMPGSANVWPPA